MLDEIGPDLYTANAFRVTGLSVRASARDVRRRSERLRAAERYGVGADGTGAPLLPLRHPPDAAATQEIVQGLRDPERRLRDELFWFWPDGSDAATDALRRGDPDAADEEWRRADTPVARHNRAVLAHARALDAADPDRTQWERALTAWRAVLGDDAFWDRFEDRAAEFDDPRLASPWPRKVRRALPAALLSINATLAVRAWRDGRQHAADTHLALLDASGFPRDTIDDVRRQAVQPDRAWITALCDTAERTTDDDPESGDTVAADLLDQTARPLAALGFALDGDDPALTGARDQVARQVMRCAIGYGNRTRDWAAVREHLKGARDLAAGESTGADIARNLAVAEQNVRDASCLFCTRPADDDRAIKRTMYGQVSRGQFRVTWRTGEIAIPRCPACQAWQTARAVLFGLGWVVWAALVVWMFAAFSVPLLLANAAMAVIQWTLGPRGLTPRQRRDVKRFGPVADLLAKGWAFGARPPGVN